MIRLLPFEERNPRWVFSVWGPIPVGPRSCPSTPFLPRQDPNSTRRTYTRVDIGPAEIHLNITYLPLSQSAFPAVKYNIVAAGRSVVSGVANCGESKLTPVRIVPGCKQNAFTSGLYSITRVNIRSSHAGQSPEEGNAPNAMYSTNLFTVNLEIV